MHSQSLGARAFIPALLAGIVLIGLAPATPAAAAEPTTEAQQIIQIAKAQIGDPWVYGATGPSSFDCSGLVIYSFKAAGDYAAIGSGTYRSARAQYDWFRGRGLASRTNPKPGDLVVWGSGSHIGIYIGSGMAISTLTSGVKVHAVTAVTATFTAYLHTGMSTKLISTTTATTTATIGTRVISQATNLRIGHSTLATAIAYLPAGRTVAVIRSWKDANARTWYYVQTGGRIGWVAGWRTR
ncbi:MAG: C40 family peptidase [Chloroflexi bacterium]|nr:C40 family peptidase [Chloroflexota bacterium]